MIHLFHSFAVFILLLSCQQINSSQINADQLKELQEKGVVIVDIRTNKEYQAGHIPDVELNIDYFKSDFLEQMKALNKEEPIVVHCARGGRSGKAVKLLRKEGFLEIYDYVGGFNDWKSRGEKVEK